MAEDLSIVSSNEKKRKRPRAARACELCRAKKYRCDELFPCSQCKRQKVECVYDVADHVRQRIMMASSVNDQEASAPSQYESNIQGVRSQGTRPGSHDEHTSITTSNGTPGTHQRSPIPVQWTQINARSADTTPNVRPNVEDLPGISAEDDHDVEVSGVNPHTQNLEFHGKTSSIAFLAALQTQNEGRGSKGVRQDSVPQHTKPSLVSMLHNEAFSPETLAHTPNEAAAALGAERYYFRQSQQFLDGFFQNIHFVHPILDRQAFMARCEDLWFGRSERQPKCFVALYYSIMSLGALTKTWDEDTVDGLGRLEWSRKLFDLTRTAVGGLASMTAIESVQCLFFMAKISQNELNPSLAYLYLGWATRASFSAGFNRRQISNTKDPDPTLEQVSKLWWGLYSLEIEVSFALGRPDSLGSDVYHNQLMPALDETETAVIPVMVHFARIIREVSVSVHLSNGPLLEKAAAAFEIESRMKAWLRDVPVIIRPSILETVRPQKITKSPTWAKRQRLVLELRFYNIKMVLFRPFLTIAAKFRQNIPEEIEEAMEKCVSAARCTIEIIHEIYCHHTFFRTWWYNTTYVLYAASILLCYGIKVAQKTDKFECFKLSQQAVEILDAMEESTVATNASHTIKQILASAEDDPEITSTNTHNDKPNGPNQTTKDGAEPNFSQFADDSLMSFLNLDENLDFLAMTFPLNSSHFPFWNDAGDHF